MNIREALIQQSPSLALQRASLDEIAKLDKKVEELQEEVLSLHALMRHNGIEVE